MNNRERKTKEMFEAMEFYEKNGKRIEAKIVELLAKEKAPGVVAYHMICQIKRIMERIDPNLKRAMEVTDFLNKNLSSEQKMNFVKDFGRRYKEHQVREMVGEYHNDWNKGEKANVTICSYEGLIKGSIKTKCVECGAKCYYDKVVHGKYAKKDAKKICLKCSLKKKYSKNMNKEQVDIIKIALKNYNERTKRNKSKKGK